MKNFKTWLIRGFLLLAFQLICIAQAESSDCWISVNGSGAENGKDLQNAYSARGNPKNAQKCWEETGAGNIMHVAQGIYSGDSFWKLRLSKINGGNELTKTLRGEGKVEIVGTRPVPYTFDTKSAGEIWLQIGANVENVTIENFYVSRVAHGITALEGGNHHLQLKNLHFSDTRQNIHLIGHPDCIKMNKCPDDNPKVSSDITIEDTEGLRYSKRHIRLGEGIHHVKVMRSQADAEFLDGDFAVGFDVEGPSHDIEFLNSVGRRNRYTLSEYWNGDGFKSEETTYRIKWINCAAFDNADAGFDIKTKDAYLENIIALRNNRNVRIWSSERAILKNINASYSISQGGVGTPAGLWVRGSAECHHCTLHGNATQLMVEEGPVVPNVTFYDSILSTSSTDQELSRIESQDGKTSVQFLRSNLWQEGVNGEDPLFGPNAVKEWEGNTNAFNSQKFGSSKGYYYEPPIRVS